MLYTKLVHVGERLPEARAVLQVQHSIQYWIDLPVKRFRAKYYLSTALNLPPRNECEKCCISGVKSLLTKLEKYDLGKDLLYENMEFGFED